MIDINNIVNTAIQQEVSKAITSYIDAYFANVQQEHQQQLAALKEEIEQLKQQRADSPATGSDAVQSRPTVDFITNVLTLIKEHADVREAVQQLVRSEIEAAVDEAIGAHCSDYDHDEYDSTVTAVNDADLDSLPDFDDFVRHEDLGSAIEDKLNGASISISI